MLFAAFVALQLTTLFGGDEHVLRTAGLTYAEYAHAGLRAAAGGGGADARRWSRSRAATRGALRVLLGLLCALTLVVLASALKRLGLYEEAFGFTRLRLLAARRDPVARRAVRARRSRRARCGARAWLPRATVALSAAAALAFALANPDARIAEHNIERYGRTGDARPRLPARTSARTRRRRSPAAAEGRRSTQRPRAR